jgi:hypothetical protein
MAVLLAFAAFELLEIWPLYNAAALVRQVEAIFPAHIARAMAKGHCPATVAAGRRKRHRGAGF